MSDWSGALAQQLQLAWQQWQQQPCDRHLLQGALLQQARQHWPTLESLVASPVRDYFKLSTEREWAAAVRVLAEAALHNPLPIIQQTLNRDPTAGLIQTLVAVGDCLEHLQQVPDVLLQHLRQVLEIARETAVSRLEAGAIAAVAFSPDSQKLAVACDSGVVLVLEARSLSQIHPIEAHEGAAMAVTYSPDGQWLATGGSDGLVRLWDVSGKPLDPPFIGHEGAILAIAISPDGEWIASTGSDRVVQLWTRQGVPLAAPLQGHRGIVRQLCFDPGSCLLVGLGGDGCVYRWTVGDRYLRDRLELPSETGFSLAVASSGDIAAGDSEGNLSVWDRCGHSLGCWPAHRGPLSALAFVDNTPISAGWDGSLAQWSDRGQVQRHLHSKRPEIFSAIAAAPNGFWLASGNRQGRLKLWDIRELDATPAPSEPWRFWLQVACDRLQHHPSFANPLNHSTRVACETCRRYIGE
ncbi:WD40 repeat domain-containing protein [Synechococcus sp. PCC 7336]|uniref:WD40 repeat domain-containing protein n=1 Tax=Synechococcus sp. PCC 7336 TaxID=195250 RepID=UPI000344DE73|nr:WD40 repeat domain-containing protein [Synechococcus sp. PCC 7336]